LTRDLAHRRQEQHKLDYHQQKLVG